MIIIEIAAGIALFIFVIACIGGAVVGWRQEDRLSSYRNEEKVNNNGS